MIGLLVLVIVVLYVMLYKYVVSKVYEKTKSVKKTKIAMAIMILIPTWDLILGFPVYAYLCAFESGTKIYKTVDNVEGFYVGERGMRYQPHEPYKGYKYIEYKEMRYSKPTGKYYRSYWVDYYKDRNATELCVYPRYPKNLDDPYTKAVNNGRCIVKEEIAENEISRWDASWSQVGKKYHSFEIFPLGIKIKKVAQIKDRVTKKILSETFSVRWDTGWFFGILSSFETGHPRSWYCGTDYANVFELYHKTLKTKKETE